MNRDLTICPRTPAANQTEVLYEPSSEEAELIQLSREWMHVALIEKAEPRLRELMAPEFTLQIWDASRAAQSLESWLHMLTNRLTDLQFEYTSISARVFGDVGIVYSTFSWSGAMDGTAFSDAGFMADFWSRRTDRWQVVARRSAPQQQIRQLRKC